MHKCIFYLSCCISMGECKLLLGINTRHRTNPLPYVLSKKIFQLIHVKLLWTHCFLWLLHSSCIRAQHYFRTTLQHKISQLIYVYKRSLVSASLFLEKPPLAVWSGSYLSTMSEIFSVIKLPSLFFMCKGVLLNWFIQQITRIVFIK